MKSIKKTKKNYILGNCPDEVTLLMLQIYVFISYHNACIVVLQIVSCIHHSFIYLIIDHTRWQHSSM